MFIYFFFGDKPSDLYSLRQLITYGKDIFEDRVEFHYKDFSESLPSVRCNDVSFMKIEELDENCRNILAVANTYICYSVTSKRNLLRLIDSLTGEKGILRAHEANIADIQVSPVDHSYFGSVDSVESTSFSHTFIWKRGAKNIDFTQAASLPMKANLIRAHPEQATVWAVCDGKQFSVFNIDKIPSNPSYSSFSMNYNADDDSITGTFRSLHDLRLLLFLSFQIYPLPRTVDMFLQSLSVKILIFLKFSYGKLCVLLLKPLS